MTGAYLRVQRDGVWESIEIEHLTDTEREYLFLKGERTAAELIKWVHMLCEKMAQVELFMDGLVEDGIIDKQ